MKMPPLLPYEFQRLLQYRCVCESPTCKVGSFVVITFAIAGVITKNYQLGMN
jgi:hypothetical protein